MKTAIYISIITLLFALCAGCSEPEAVPPPEPAVVETPIPAPEPAPIATPEPEPVKTPEPAVPKADIEKAARFYDVVHSVIADGEKEKTLAGLMEVNGWTDETYQALLYDIAQDQPSREAYIALTGSAVQQ